MNGTPPGFLHKMRARPVGFETKLSGAISARTGGGITAMTGAVCGGARRQGRGGGAPDRGVQPNPDPARVRAADGQPGSSGLHSASRGSSPGGRARPRPAAQPGAPHRRRWAVAFLGPPRQGEKEVDTVDGPRLTVDGPVACVFRVQGALDPQWADRLGGLAVTVAGAGEPAGAATTELRGELPDQVALRGVLTTLCDLRRPLLNVVCTLAQPAAANGSVASGRPTAPRRRASLVAEPEAAGAG